MKVGNGFFWGYRFYLGVIFDLFQGIFGDGDFVRKYRMGNIV